MSCMLCLLVCVVMCCYKLLILKFIASVLILLYYALGKAGSLFLSFTHVTARSKKKKKETCTAFTKPFCYCAPNYMTSSALVICMAFSTKELHGLEPAM